MSSNSATAALARVFKLPDLIIKFPEGKIMKDRYEVIPLHADIVLALRRLDLAMRNDERVLLISP
jgi:hypothetical protein